jgi:hypothetical protein
MYAFEMNKWFIIVVIIIKQHIKNVLLLGQREFGR